MIERVILAKLKSDFCNDEARAELVEKSHECLSAIPGVRRCVTGLPADEASLASWDVMIRLHFDDLEAVEAYRVHELHQAYLDEVLLPRTEVKKVWNFVLSERKA